MTIQNTKNTHVRATPYYRFWEVLVPILVWLTITMPIWLSPFRPALASYLILSFFIYFLYKTLKTVYFATVSFRLMQKAEKTDWLEMLKEFPNTDDIEHFVLIVTYKEPIKKLEETCQRLADQHYDKKKIHIMLGMEAREAEEGIAKSKALQEKFGNVFAGVYATFHELGEHEVVGKASNATWAAKEISRIAEKKGYAPENVVITVCDADSLLPLQYIPYLTYKFLKDENRLFHFFCAPVLLYNNFWKLPLPIRMQNMLSSVGRFAYMSQSSDLIQVSTYSTNLWMLHKTDYWDTDIIPEDWHIFMQAFFTLGENVKTIPLYLPIVRDGVLSTTLFKTFKSRYSQEKRWASGASDIPYAIVRAFHSPHIKWSTKLKRILYVTEVHFLWPTSFFILTVSASIPSLVNPVFGRTVLGYLLPKLSSGILTFSSILVIVIVFFDYKLRERVNIKTELKNMPLLLVQWYFLPLVSFAFSSLPALEAHTRMLLGKKLEYKVTEKI